MLFSLKRALTLFIYFIFIFTSGSAFGQDFTISGKVTDASTGEAVPFANVYFKTLKKGTTTNFEGYYQFKIAEVEDSLTAQYLGYHPRSKAVDKLQRKQIINFQLDPTSIQLEEVVIRPGENPAWRILRGVWANKSKNDKAELAAYQYESYSKIEMDADNIDKRFKNSKVMKPFQNIFDSLKLQAGEDGNPVLPFFISETLSDVYYIKSADRKHEHIKATKLIGVGLDDGSIMSQLVGSTFLDYNFYQNWMTILDKNFISPIADGGLGFYRYYLVDSGFIDNRYCYKIEFKPKQPKDLAFTGTMWIADTSFALKRIIVETGRDANLNYVERLKIQQDLEQASSGHWLPAKVRILVDIAEITDKSFGMLGKMYVSNKNFVVNQPKPLKFYEDRFQTDPDAQNFDTEFWNENRHDSLTAEDKKVIQMVDTIRNMPRVKSYIEIADIIINGHVKVGPVEIGPHVMVYGNNREEGHRFRLGFRTNTQFSRTYILKGYAAIGTKDFNRSVKPNGLKYSIQAERFLSRKNWTKIGVQYKHDIEGLGLEENFFDGDNLLMAVSQVGLLTRFNRIKQGRVWIESDIIKGLNARTYLLRKSIEPRQYDFAYRPHMDGVVDKFNITEAALEVRYAHKEAYIINDNRRQRLGLDKAPIITVQYAHGFRRFLGGDFDYNRASVSIEQKFKAGALGRGHYIITGTKIFERLPYPLLTIASGNETFILSERGFNLLNFFEFVSDESVSFHYIHHFDGILMNRVPLLRQAKLRERVGVRSMWGSIKPANRYDSPYYSETDGFRTFNKKEGPYVEVFYGIENLFRFVKIDVVHRLNYLDKPSEGLGIKDPRRWGVVGGFYFSF